MKPPIIAIEGVNTSGVNAQVDKLEEVLVKEGLRVAVFKFPQSGKNSSYFVNNYQAGKYGSNINPYASSIFYALDRFDAQQDIKDCIARKDVIILSNYIGSSLALQGSRFSGEQQKAFFVWLDSFETQYFGNIRPGHSFVINSEPTANRATKAFDALCKNFPKDYSCIYLKDQSDDKLINAIKSVVVKPKVEAKKQKSLFKKKRNTASVLDLLRTQTSVEDIKISKKCIDIPNLNQHQLQLYRAGIEELSRIRNKIIKETPVNKRGYTAEYLSVLSTIVSYTGNQIKKTSTKHGKFEDVLHDSVKLSYSSGIKTGAEITNVIPRNQMTIVNDILFAVTDLSQQQIIEQANKITYEKKSELIRSYIKDNHGTGLNNVSYTFNIGATMHDILWLKRYLQKETITIQDPSPRNGYDVPKWATKQARLYEDFFDYLIDVNSKLSNTEASKYLVALGNITSAKIKLSYHELNKLKAAKDAPQIAHDIVMAAAVTHPILYE